VRTLAQVIAHLPSLAYNGCVTRRRSRHRPYVLALAALAVVGTATIPAEATDARGVRVVATADSSLSEAKVRPLAVEFLMTGDYMTRLRWRSWARARAEASGIYNMNLCNPCAAGHIRRMVGRLTLSRIITCKGVSLYTKAQAKYFYRGRWRVASGLGQPADPCR
jgi:hypothetical protein